MNVTQMPLIRSKYPDLKTIKCQWKRIAFNIELFVKKERLFRMWGKEKGTNKQPWTGVKQHPTFTIWPSWMKPQEAQRYKEADREPRKSLGGGGCKKEPREDWILMGDGEDEERTGAADEESSRSNNRWAGWNMRMVGKKRAISMKEQRSRRQKSQTESIVLSSQNLSTLLLSNTYKAISMFTGCSGRSM